MRKAITIFVILDLLMVAAWIVLGVATSGADDFSGLVVIYPMIGFALVSCALCVLVFIHALHKASHPVPSSAPGVWTPDYQRSWPLRAIGIIVTLVGLPTLGILFSLYGDGRGGLLLLFGVMLLIGSAFSVRYIVKSR